MAWLYRFRASAYWAWKYRTFARLFRCSATFPYSFSARDLSRACSRTVAAAPYSPLYVNATPRSLSALDAPLKSPSDVIVQVVWAVISSEGLIALFGVSGWRDRERRVNCGSACGRCEPR